ncbi:hypothetical protein LTR53_009595 [Teratosphaeriaceae sp. CCFEE 6253]|nr:hypothetical protein LTR53_009595 [Teratosphaeriaceae sp. CCFEE 6253]
MSKHGDDGISFSILPEDRREHFRLLELPRELLQSLGSNTALTLQFKSPQLYESGEAEAVLCTPDRTYNIKQVSTSNSVYICQPIETAADNDGTPQSGLQAIAQSNWTLEPSLASWTGPVNWLKPRLPRYSSTGTYESRDLLSKQQLFDDMPMSQGECEEAWKSLACFELSQPGGSFLPTANAKVRAWRAILETATASGLDLTNHFAPSKQKPSVDHDEDCPAELVSAVLLGMTNSEGYVDEKCCVLATGLSLLESAFRLSLGDFIKQWRDSLPEPWRPHARLDALPRTMYTLSDNGKTVTYPLQGDPGGSTTAVGNSATGSKRKWHDKFRESKKSA